MQKMCKNLSIFLVFSVLSVSMTGCAVKTPDSTQFTSIVKYTQSFSGRGYDLSKTVASVRSIDTHTCVGKGSSARTDAFFTGVNNICSKANGQYQKPFCIGQKTPDMVLFVADAKLSHEVRCTPTTDWQTLKLIAAEPASSLDDPAFQQFAEYLGFKTSVIIAEENRKKQQVSDARRLAIQADKLKHQRAMADAIKQAQAMRKSLTVGTKTNCGLVVEIRSPLAKVYHPVEGFGAEHWIEINKLFTADIQCNFLNGRYIPPYL